LDQLSAIYEALLDELQSEAANSGN